ncbi:MAG: Mth938-like domain-containing protein [Burkholderiales bacterium]
MKLHLNDARGNNQFTGYGDGYVQINGENYSASLIVLPTQIIQDWHEGGVAALSEVHFERMLELDCEIVLLGTGKVLRFPHPSLSRSLLHARVGLEVMDSAAACRTYNILLAEGRKVAAALLLETTETSSTDSSVIR